MEFNKPHIKSKTVWRITRLITFFVFLLIFLVGTLLYFTTDIIPSVYIIWGLGALCIWRLICAIVYPIIEYRQWKYAITPEKIHIEHGIFFLKTSIIPIVRIQHITFSRGLINRKFSLVSLKIHTASSAFEIDGLHEDVAKDISEKLNEKLYHRLKVKEESESED